MDNAHLMKKFISLILLVLSLHANCFSMDSYVFGGTNAAPSASAVRVMASSGADAAEWRTGSDERTRTTWPLTGVGIEDLTVSVTTAPAAGKSFAYQLYAGASGTTATGITCTIADANTTCSDLTNTYTPAAGDILIMRATPTGTPTLPGRVMWNFKIAGGTQQSAILGHISNLDSATLVRISSIYGTGFVSTSANVMPTAGTFSRLFVTHTDPGVGNTRDVELYKNGVATGLKVSLSSGSGIGNDVTNTFTVAQGDLVDIRSTPTAGTPTAARFGWGVQFAPTVDGESVVMGMANAGYAGGSLFMQHGADAGNATESLRNMVFPATTLQKLYQYNQVAPGVGNSRILRARIAGANGNLVATCTTTATCVDNSNSDTVTSGQVFDFGFTETGTPSAALETKWGVVMYASTTSIKTVNGLAKASVKTKNGLAIASVKSINGLS